MSGLSTPHHTRTPPAPSRSPSSTSASDADASMDQEEESADDSDFLDVEDLTGENDSNVDLLAPALATPRPNAGEAVPWPYTSKGQSSPIMSPSSLTGAAGHLLMQPSTSHALVFSPTLASSSQPPIPASSLPHEILLHILKLLPPTSLSPALLVCKAWCQCGVELLWHKPTFTQLSSLVKMLIILGVPKENQTFPYPTFIKRLNFTPLATDMTDQWLKLLLPCERLERLTLAGCTNLTSDAIISLVGQCRNLVALDLSDVKEADDRVVKEVAESCRNLQGLNLSGCKKVTDEGIEMIAKKCTGLRRIKLRNVEQLTDFPIILLSLHCHLLLEVDLIHCPHITSLSILQLFRTSHHLRELSLQACHEITDLAFPDPLTSNQPPEEAEDPNPSPTSTQYLQSTSTGSLIRKPIALKFAPQVRMFDHLRYLDLTSLTGLTDTAVAGIVKYMPRIRNLILAKCTGLTDEAVYSICTLGKHLHYLHMGHVSAITDRAVTRLARSCQKLRYIDLACCNLLTDMSVFELAHNLHRLKRIGLVRVGNLTDDAIQALFVRHSLERIHLSYCDNITVGAIHELLLHLTKLTHLSLTGVPAFRREDLQKWCRQPPRDFDPRQRQAFCVYSGKGVQDLRRYLQSITPDVAEDGALEVTRSQVQAARARQQPRHGHHHAAHHIQQIPPHNPNGGTMIAGVIQRGGGPPPPPSQVHRRLFGTGGPNTIPPPNIQPSRQGAFRPIPIQYVAPGTAAPASVITNGHGRGGANLPSRASAPPALSSPFTFYQPTAAASTSTTAAGPSRAPAWLQEQAGSSDAMDGQDPSGWQWDPRLNVSSYVTPGGNPANSNSLRLRDDANGGMGTFATTAPDGAQGDATASSRPRRATVTRGNYRGAGTEEDMEEDEDSDGSFEEEDAQMA